MKNGVEFVGHVPHIAPEAYWHVLFPGLAEPQLVELETQIRKVLPAGYREFLSVMNGAKLLMHVSSISSKHTIGSYSITLFGLRGVLGIHTLNSSCEPFCLQMPNTGFERPRGLPREYVVIGSFLDDYLAESIASGEVIRIKQPGVSLFDWRRTGKRALYRWASLHEFLQSEIRRIGALFSNPGIIGEENLAILEPPHANSR